MKLITLSKKNPLLELAKFGQSIWLDYSRRDLILTGKLWGLIQEDTLRGTTAWLTIVGSLLTLVGCFASLRSA